MGGEQTRRSGCYSLDPKGQPHSAMISTETIALVIYMGEPGKIKGMEIVDISSAG